jgi:hypothetical protein
MASSPPSSLSEMTIIAGAFDALRLSKSSTRHSYRNVADARGASRRPTAGMPGTCLREG